jgi:hypothetical protein
MMINQAEPATRADLEQLRVELRNDIAMLDVRIDSLDKRLAVIQWIGVIFLAINGSLIAFNGALIGVLLWTLAKGVVR